MAVIAITFKTDKQGEGGKEVAKDIRDIGEAHDEVTKRVIEQLDQQKLLEAQYRKTAGAVAKVREAFPSDPNKPGKRSPENQAGLDAGLANIFGQFPGGEIGYRQGERLAFAHDSGSAQSIESIQSLIKSNGLTTAIRELQKSGLGSIAEELSKIPPTIPPSIKHMKELREETEHTKHEAESMSKKFRESIEIIFAAFAANAISEHTIGEFAKFEAELGKLKRAGDETAHSLHEIDQFAVKGATTKFSIDSTVLVQVATVATQLGLKGSESINHFTNSVATMATITKVAMPEAAKEIARLKSATGESEEELDRFLNALSVIGPKSIEGTQAILSTTTALVQQAAQFKISSVQALGLAGAIDQFSKRPQLFARELPNILTEIAKAADQGTKGMELLTAATGVSQEEFKKLTKENPLEAFSVFLKAGKQLQDSPSEFKSFLSTFNISGTQLISTLGAITKNQDQFFQKVKDTEEASKDNYAQQKRLEEVMGELSNRFQLAKNAASEFGVSLGAAAAPPVAAAFSVITTAINTLRAAWEAIPGPIRTVIAAQLVFVAGIEGAKLAMVQFGKLTAGLFEGFTSPTLKFVENIKKIGTAYQDLIPKITEFSLAKVRAISVTAVGGATLAAQRAKDLEAIKAGLDFSKGLGGLHIFAAEAAPALGLMDKMKLALASLAEGFKTFVAGLVALAIANPLVTLTFVALAAAAGLVYWHMDKIKATGDVFAKAKQSSDELFEKLERARKEKEKLEGHGDHGAAHALDFGVTIGTNATRAELAAAEARIEYFKKEATFVGKYITEAIYGNAEEQENNIARLRDKLRVLNANRGDAHTMGDHASDEHEKEAAAERARLILSEESRRILQNSASVARMTDEYKKLANAIKEAEAINANPLDKKGAERTNELTLLQAKREQAQLSAQIDRAIRDTINPLNEQERQWKRQVDESLAVNQAQKDRLAVEQAITDEMLKRKDVGPEDIRRITAGIRATQVARDFGAARDEINNLGKANDLNRQIGLVEKDRVELNQRILQFIKEYPNAQGPALQKLTQELQLEKDIANAKALKTQLAPTLAATEDYLGKLRQIDDLQKRGIINDQMAVNYRRTLAIQTLAQRDPLGEIVRQQNVEVGLLEKDYKTRDSIARAQQTILDLQRQGVVMSKEQEKALEGALVKYNEAIKKLSQLENSGFGGFARSIPDFDVQIEDLKKNFAEGLSSAVSQGLIDGFTSGNPRQAIAQFLRNFGQQMVKTGTDALLKMFIESEAGGGLLKSIFGDPTAKARDAAKAAKDQFESIQKSIAQTTQQIAQANINIAAATVNMTGDFTRGIPGLDKGDQNFQGVGSYAFGKDKTMTLPGEIGQLGAEDAIGKPFGFGFSSMKVGALSGPASLSSFGNLFENKDFMANYIRQAAVMRGIDPDIALRVAKSEGFSSYIGDQGTSFGPFQLHYKNNIPGLSNAGLGDKFTEMTGLDARDPSTVQKQIDFALDQAKKDGWGAWHGAAKAGISPWQGIGSAKSDIPVGGPVSFGGDGSGFVIPGIDQANKQIAEASDQLAKASTQLGSTFSSASTMIGSSAENATTGLDSLASKLLGGNSGGSGGGLLSGLFGGGSLFGGSGSSGLGLTPGAGGLYHSGGIVGEGGSPIRIVSASLFSGAPRYHGGLKDKEFPAILERGERVLTANDNRRVMQALDRAAQAGGIPTVGGGGMDHRPPMIVQNIYTPDHGSFRRSESQINNKMGTAVKRAMSRNQ